MSWFYKRSNLVGVLLLERFMNWLWKEAAIGMTREKPVQNYCNYCENFYLKHTVIPYVLNNLQQFWDFRWVKLIHFSTDFLPLKEKVDKIKCIFFPPIRIYFDLHSYSFSLVSLIYAILNQTIHPTKWVLYKNYLCSSGILRKIHA